MISSEIGSTKVRRSIEIFFLSCAACGTPGTTPDAGVDTGADAGTPWTLVASGLPAQIVQSLAIDPADPNRVFAGLTVDDTSGTGVFATTNGGASWTASNTNIATSPVFSIAIDPSDPTKMYAGLFGALVSSTDRGATWAPYDAGGTIVATNGPVIVAFAPSDATRACVGGHRGLWCTTTHGTTWDALVVAPTQPNIFSIAFDPSDATTFWANDTLWQNETLAATKAPGDAVAFDGATLWAGLYPDNGATGVRTSANAGAAWSDASDGIAGNLVRQIAVAHDHVVYATAGTAAATGRAYMLATGALYTRASTWTVDAGVPNANVVAVAPSDDRVVYVGTLDGRVYRRGP